MLGSDEDIKLGLSDGKVIGTILGNVDGITLGIDVRTEMDYLDGSFDGSSGSKLEGLFLEFSMESTDVKVIESDKIFLLSFSFTHSLTLLVGFCWYGHVRCLFFVRKLLWRRKVIVIDDDFTEICEDVMVSAFGV